jgi:hypothetical protein
MILALICAPLPTDTVVVIDRTLPSWPWCRLNASVVLDKTGNSDSQTFGRSDEAFTARNTPVSHLQVLAGSGR